MGRVTEVSPTVSVETRRGSAALIIDGASATEDPGVGRIEFEYARVFALKGAVEVIITSAPFQAWLAKREAKR